VVAVSWYAPGMKKAIRIVLGVILSAFLLTCHGCAGFFGSKPEESTLTPPLSADYLVIEDVGKEQFFLIDNDVDVESYLDALSSPYELKTRESFKVHAIEDGLTKHTFYLYQPQDYVEWDRDIPHEALSLTDTFLTTQYEVSHYEFTATGPTRQQALIQAVNTEEGLDFYYPVQSFDSRYHQISLSYECTDRDLEEVGSVPLGEYSVDDVFLPGIDYLSELGVLYKTLDVTYGGSGDGREESFHRSVYILVGTTVSDTQREELESIMQASTSYPPYVVDSRPSGRVLYEESPPYTLDMVTKNVLTSSDVDALRNK